MSINIEPYLATEEERQKFARDFEEAHRRGEISDRDFTRARCEAAGTNWCTQAWEAAGRPDSMPDSLFVDRPENGPVGVPAIDAAMPYLKPNGDKTRTLFISGVAYLCDEREDALEVAKARTGKLDEAAALLRQAAALLDGDDTGQHAKIARSLALWTEKARYGRAYLTTLANGRLRGHFRPDALTAEFTAKRGKTSRDAVFIKALAKYFPDTPDFFANGGYSVIANVARACGVDRRNLSVIVRSTLLEQQRRPQPAPAPALATNEADRKTASLMRLLGVPK